MPAQSLEDRVLRLEDRAALDDLNTRYFLAADGDDLKGVGDSFTTDAIFMSSGHVGGAGRDGIVEFIASSRRHMGLTVHTPHYCLYSFSDRDSATGIVGAHLELVLAGQPTYGAVRYVDTYRKEAGQWLIAKRDMRTIYMGTWSEAPSIFASANPVRWPGAEPCPSDYPRKA